MHTNDSSWHADAHRDFHTSRKTASKTALNCPHSLPRVHFRLPRSKKNTLPRRIMCFYVTVGWLSNLGDWHLDFIFSHACAAIDSSFCKMKYLICCWGECKLLREILWFVIKKSWLFIRSAHFHHSNSIMCSWNRCFAQDRSALWWHRWTRICFFFFWEI